MNAVPTWNTVSCSLNTSREQVEWSHRQETTTMSLGEHWCAYFLFWFVGCWFVTVGRVDKSPEVSKLTQYY